MTGINRIIRQNDYSFTMLPNDAVRDPEISPNAFRLLAYLLSHENGYELVYGQIERQTGMGKYAIKASIDTLTQKGYLRVEQSRRNDGSFGSYNWLLLDPNVIDPQRSRTVAGSIRPGSTRPLKEDKDSKKINNLEDKETFSAFDDFWNAYPKKLDKGKARKAFDKALNTASAETIIQGAKNYASDPNLPESQFVKYPATWLNAESWANPPLPKRVLTDEQRRQEEIRKLLEQD